MKELIPVHARIIVIEVSIIEESMYTVLPLPTHREATHKMMQKIPNFWVLEALAHLLLSAAMRFFFLANPKIFELKDS